MKKLVLLFCLLWFGLMPTAQAQDTYQSYWLANIPYNQNIDLSKYQINKSQNVAYTILSSLVILGYDINWNNGIEVAQEFANDQGYQINDNQFSAQLVNTLDQLLLNYEPQMLKYVQKTIELFPNTTFTLTESCDYEPNLFYMSELVKIGQQFLPEHRLALHTLVLDCQINGPRGLGGKNKIIIQSAHLMSSQKFQALFAHEMGHVIVDTIGASAISPITTEFSDPISSILADNQNLGFFEISWVAFANLQIGAQRADFVSGYAMTNIHEDLAESISSYTTLARNFRYQAQYSPALQAKYDFIKNVYFKGQEFMTGKNTNLPNVYDITGE